MKLVDKIGLIADFSKSLGFWGYTVRTSSVWLYLGSGRLSKVWQPCPPASVFIRSLVGLAWAFEQIERRGPHGKASSFPPSLGWLNRHFGGENDGLR